FSPKCKHPLDVRGIFRALGGEGSQRGFIVDADSDQFRGSASPSQLWNRNSGRKCDKRGPVPAHAPWLGECWQIEALSGQEIRSETKQDHWRLENQGVDEDAGRHR